MAEVLGVTSASIGITGFALQIANNIKAIRTAYKFNKNKAEGELASLSERLEALREALLSLTAYDGDPIVDLVIKDCQSRYSVIDDDLRKLLGKFTGKSQQNGPNWKSIRLALSTELKEEINESRQRLTDMLIWLSVALQISQLQNRPTHRSPDQNFLSLGNSSLESTSHDLSTVKEGKEQTTQVNVGTISELEPPAAIPGKTSVKSSRVAKASRCGVRNCFCSCHLVQRTSGRFWGLQYTPVSVLFGNCNDKRCTTKRSQWNFRVALSKYGFPWAVIVGLEVISGTGRYAIQPTLRVSRVVPYTSPGFQIIWRWKTQQTTIAQAKAELSELHVKEPGFHLQVNPNGNDFIDELLCHGPLESQREQFDLLDFFISKFGLDLEGRDKRFLTACARWIGEGRHLDLLDTILQHGFDPIQIHSPLSEEWPLPCSPGWISEHITPDPFFIEYLAKLVKDNPGFSGVTTLHEFILNGSLESVSLWLRRSQLLIEDVNFLGQTPLHLAVTNIQCFQLVLDAGHDIDVTDKWGITPLMYAAAMGHTEVTRILISRGADIFQRCRVLNRNFVNYAAVRGHWELIMNALSAIKSHFKWSDFQYFVDYAIMLALSLPSAIHWTKSHFSKLVRLCDDVNFTFTDSYWGTGANNLMHYVRSLEEAQILVDCGFNLFNQPNSKGELAINSLAWCPDASVIQLCIQHQTDISHKNEDNHTVLLRLFLQLGSFGRLAWDATDSIKECLAAGADPFSADHCICPCSPEGCSVAAVFDPTFESSYYMRKRPHAIWMLELLSLIEEYHGQTSAKRILLSFIRRVQSDKREITHVCCHRGRGIRPYRCRYGRRKTILEEDMKEVTEEEIEVIKELEQEMEDLASESYHNLRLKWMHILKENYEIHVKSVREENVKRMSAKRHRRVRYEVDYESDCYNTTYDLDWSLPPHSVCRLMAEYAFWLEHEFSRRKPLSSNGLSREDWYHKRISGFIELMNVMNVAENEIVEEMMNIDIEETRSERVEKGSIINHFKVSVQRNGLQKCGRLTQN